MMAPFQISIHVASLPGQTRWLPQLGHRVFSATAHPAGCQLSTPPFPSPHAQALRALKPIFKRASGVAPHHATAARGAYTLTSGAR